MGAKFFSFFGIKQPVSLEGQIILFAIYTSRKIIFQTSSGSKLGGWQGGKLQSLGGTPTALQNAVLLHQPITAAKGELPFQKEGLSQNQSSLGYPTSVRQVRGPRGWALAGNRVAVWVSLSAGCWGAQSPTFCNRN